MLKPILFMVYLYLFLSHLETVTTKNTLDHPKILDVVTARGYPFETHQVTTSDGYILSMHRIPHGKTTKVVSNKPVLLQHALYASSDLFLISKTTHGLGYVLADSGYDVWLGNYRGTQHSRNHTSLNPDKGSKFWQFSWHEMGEFDLPAMIDYVLNVTKQEKLHYVGHSQATTTFYVLVTTCPEYNNKIRAQISLGPVVYLSHTKDPSVTVPAHFSKSFTKMIRILRINECASSQQIAIKVLKRLCLLSQPICVKILKIVLGMDVENLSTSLSMMLRFLPAGFSAKQLIHYLQVVNSKSFNWYDYGKNNLKVYGSIRPPEYNLSLVTTPSYLFYSSGDRLLQEIDISMLCRETSRACLGQFLIPDENFSHFDLTLGIRAPELVYQKMLDVMHQH